MKKKILSLPLALVMVLAFVPITPVAASSDPVAVMVSSSETLVRVIDADGNLWAKGHTTDLFGTRLILEGTDEFVKIMEGTKFKLVDTDGCCTLAIDSDGGLWSWGLNSRGNLGDGTTTDRTTPVRIMSGTKFVDVSVGSGKSLAIDEAGNLWAWGGFWMRGYDEVLVLTPQMQNKGTKYKGVYAGGLSSWALGVDGQVYNVSGLVEITNNVGWDKRMNWSNVDGKVAHIAVGSNHRDIFVLTDDGSVWNLYRSMVGEQHYAAEKTFKNMKFKDITYANIPYTTALQTYGLGVDGNIWRWKGYTYMNGFEFGFAPEIMTSDINFVQLSGNYAIDENGGLWYIESFIRSTEENSKIYKSVFLETRNIWQSDPLNKASSWARDGITTAIDKGFVSAEIQGYYTNVITRQEFCRMAVKWLEYKEGKSIDTILSEQGKTRDSNAFTDTSDPDILAAYALGITSGTDINKFTPNGEFTREQAATMIRNTCKAAGMDISNVASANFADISTASTWAVDSINFCRNNGIMQGTSNNNFSPQGLYTREQSIITFNNIM